MTKTTSRAIPEFNAQILDSIINTHGLPDQTRDEFTLVDLIGRGWRRGVARAFCERGLLSGKLERRMGRSKATGRASWLYRQKGK